MPASAFSALAAVVLHANVPIDSDIGIRNGMEQEGILLNSINYRPTREQVSHTNFRKVKAVHIFSTPEMVLEIDGKVTLLQGTLGARHPGAPIHKDFVTNFYEDVSFGFDPEAEGYWIYGAADFSSPPADLHTTKFPLTWFPAVPSTAVNHVAAPDAPA